MIREDVHLGLLFKVKQHIRDAVVVVAFLFSLLFACDARDGHIVEIASLRENPDVYRGVTITVSGYATKFVDVPLLRYDFVRITDGTGEMWILSRVGSPPTQRRLFLHGECKTLRDVVMLIGESNMKQVRFLLESMFSDTVLHDRERSASEMLKLLFDQSEIGTSIVVVERFEISD